MVRSGVIFSLTTDSFVEGTDFCVEDPMQGDNHCLIAFDGELNGKDWDELVPGLRVKTLVIDKKQHSVEFLIKADASWEPGLHRHRCDTSLFVLEGGINNVGTKRNYGPGDFFYQERGNTHLETISERGIVAYVGMKGTDDVLVEFLDQERHVINTMNVSHFERLL